MFHFQVHSQSSNVKDLCSFLEIASRVAEAFKHYFLSNFRDRNLFTTIFSILQSRKVFTFFCVFIVQKCIGKHTALFYLGKEMCMPNGAPPFFRVALHACAFN